MKLLKSPLLVVLPIMAMGIMSVSCSSNPEFDNNEVISASSFQTPYDSIGVWANNDLSQFINVDDYVFSHIVDEYSYIYGFTLSKVSDTSEHSPLYSFPYACVSGGGVSGKGSPYFVGYWGEFMEGENCSFNERTCRIYEENGDTFEPQSVLVNNNTYLWYAVLNGTDFSPKFEAGDWVTLNAHGVHLDGTEAEAVFYLVNIESDNVEDGILKNWTEFDLRSLGKCTGIYFTMDCGENFKSEYGMNVPTYFCLDKLIVAD